MDADARPRRLWLASASPRRAEMLRRHGFAAERLPPDLDDAQFAPMATSPRHWALAMAMLKAARVRELILAGATEGRREEGPRHDRRGWILAADTVCDLDGVVLGKPRDAEECRAMLRSFVGRTHWVHTGVCLLEAAEGRCQLLVDGAEVGLGALERAAIDAYVATQAWKDKAGGYSFEERCAAGWPLRCEGDPETVMGLPMRRLTPILRSLLAPSDVAGAGAAPRPGAGRAARDVQASARPDADPDAAA